MAKVVSNFFVSSIEYMQKFVGDLSRPTELFGRKSQHISLCFFKTPKIKRQTIPRYVIDYFSPGFGIHFQERTFLNLSVVSSMSRKEYLNFFPINCKFLSEESI